MAESTANLIGKINNGPFETVGRSESWAEQRVATVTIIGKFDDLTDAVKPGDAMGDHQNWFGGKWAQNWFVRTIDLLSPDGVTGELKLSLLNCAQGKTKPYNVTWDASMEEVQMRLINHPDIIKNANIEILLKWEDTPKYARVKRDKDDNLSFFYLDYVMDSVGDLTGDLKAIDGEWEKAYCKAVTQGIETFNRYLPVIIKNSYYLELDGADYNQSHQVTGGTLRDFTGADSIGHFDTPDLKLDGYTDRDGLWFKSGDKITVQADGTAVRTETWTFTNDPSHKWVYTGNLD